MRASHCRVTEILNCLDLTDPEQAEELLALIYDDLRALAARQLRNERPGHTLQPTALVHEAYLRLVRGSAIEWESRGHFFKVAARATRQVLVDSARRRNADRRGGGWHRVTLDGQSADGNAGHEFIDLHNALERLGNLDPELEELIELRFFTGLSAEEAARVLGVSPRTAAKRWAAARLWLRNELGED